MNAYYKICLWTMCVSNVRRMFLFSYVSACQVKKPSNVSVVSNLLAKMLLWQRISSLPQLMVVSDRLVSVRSRCSESLRGSGAWGFSSIFGFATDRTLNLKVQWMSNLPSLTSVDFLLASSLRVTKDLTPTSPSASVVRTPLKLFHLEKLAK